MPLRPKQQRFVAEYLIDRNATQAAIRAGYSVESARFQGAKLLADRNVSQQIALKSHKQLEKVDLSAEKVKENIRRVLDGDVRLLFDEHGNLKPIHLLGDEAAAQIAGFEVVKRNITAGDGLTDIIYKVKLKDQSRYVEMAAKHFGLLTEKVEHSGGLVIEHMMLGDEE